MSAYALPIRSLALTAFSYATLAILAIELTRRSGGVALAWVASGMLVAVLATVRPQRWAPYLATGFATSFLVTVLLRHSLIAATGFATANILEALTTACLLRRIKAHRQMLDDASSVLRFAIVAGVVGPVVSAPIAGLTVFLAFGGKPIPTAFDWSLGHGLGMLLAAPLALIAVAPELSVGRRRPSLHELARFAALIGAVAVTAVLVFSQSRLPLLFLPALPMMVATVQLGRIGSAAALLAVAIPGAAYTIAGQGPIHLTGGDAAFRLQFFQLYLATLFLIALPTAALLARHRRLTGRLQESEAALRLLANNSGDMLFNLAIDGTIRYASPSVTALTGYDPAALIGSNAIDLIEPEHRDAVRKSHRAALIAPESNATVEYRARQQDGVARWLESNSRAIRGPDGEVTGVVCAIRDVSHRKSVERQLKLAADSDALTGLANRRPFMAALDEAAAGADDRAATLVMIDVDHFKQVNDRHGHAAGDAALVTLAEVLRRELRGDDLIARLGGEEFAVLLRGVDLDVAKATCERLRLAIAGQPILAHSVPLFRITASFGVAPVVAGASGKAVLAAADSALYAAKHAGRNRLAVAA